MSSELITVFMFASMLLLMATGQRVFGVIGFVGAAAALALWGKGSAEMPYNAAIQVTELTVALGGVDPAHAVGCPAATNYAVVQYSGSYALLVVPEGATRTLTQLGVPSVKLPRVNMKDTSVNQNACMGAVLTLTYSGSATGGAR